MCNTSFEKSIRGISLPEVDGEDIIKKMNNGSYKSIFVKNAGGGILSVTNPRDKNFKLEFKIQKELDGKIKVVGMGQFARKANGGQYMIQRFAFKEITYQSFARAISEMKHLLGDHVNFGDLESSIFAVQGDNANNHPKLK